MFTIYRQSAKAQPCMQAVWCFPREFEFVLFCFEICLYVLKFERVFGLSIYNFHGHGLKKSAVFILSYPRFYETG